MPILAELIRNVVAEHSHRVALIDSTTGVSLTYEELDRDFNRIANSLRQRWGLDVGAHVALLQRNGRYWIACEGGFAKAGVVCIPLNVHLSPAEIRWIVDHSRAEAVIFGSEEAPLLAEAGKTRRVKHFLCVRSSGESVPTWAEDFRQVVEGSAPSDPLLDIEAAHPHRVMYTSATTGKPKGVICPNEIFVDGIVTALANQLRDIDASCRFLAAAPLTHVAGSFFWAFFARGGATITMKQFRPPSFCEAIVENAVTYTYLAPTMLIMLLAYLRDHPHIVRSLRRTLRGVWYAGSPIPPAVASEAENVLGPILNQQYGMVELYGSHPCMAITHLHASMHRTKPGSCGRPILGSAVRVVDEEGNSLPVGEVGEIVIKTHSRVGGYWNKSRHDPGSFRKGSLYTGDMGYFDNDGFLYVKDRKNDMIISGGFNIYPAEVESVLYEHPAVRQCAVVGVPDDVWIEVPWAVVVPTDQQAGVDAAELIEFVRKRIAHYKAPKRVVFVDSLPVSSTGKILKRKLKESLVNDIQSGRSLERT